MTIRETSVYKKWFARLRDTVAKARILVRLRRASLGNYGETRDLGDGVSEFKFRFDLAIGSILPSAMVS